MCYVTFDMRCLAAACVPVNRLLALLTWMAQQDRILTQGLPNEAPVPSFTDEDKENKGSESKDDSAAKQVSTKRRRGVGGIVQAFIRCACNVSQYSCDRKKGIV
jgi:hypothetical protein